VQQLLLQLQLLLLQRRLLQLLPTAMGPHPGWAEALATAGLLQWLQLQLSVEAVQAGEAAVQQQLLQPQQQLQLQQLAQEEGEAAAVAAQAVAAASTGQWATL
jgi:hypothetical protein